MNGKMMKQLWKEGTRRMRDERRIRPDDEPTFLTVGAWLAGTPGQGQAQALLVAMMSEKRLGTIARNQ